MVNGQAYSTTGVFHQMSQNAEGCDVELSVNVSVKDTSYIIRDTTLCRGDLLVSGGNPIGLSGVYPFHYNSQYGCDSTIVYSVELRDTYKMFVDTFFCSGKPIVLGGQQISSAQTIEVDYFSQNSCDSTVVYRVLEVSPFFQEIDTFICEGSALIFKGDTLRTEDVYMFMSSKPGVCDSMWRVNLTVGDNVITYLDTIICPNQSLHWHNTKLTSTGVYQHLLPAANGCDSLLKMSLTVLGETTTEVEMVSGISCFGMADGIARIRNSDSNARVIWPDNFEGVERAGLDTGTYEIRIINGPGCISTFEFTLDQPEPLQLDVDKVDANCQDDHSGKIEILKMNGGTGNLSILINGQRRSPVNGVVNGLLPGHYTIDLLDENGCMSSSEVEIDQVVAGSVELDATDVEIVEGDSVILNLRTQGIDSLVLIDWYGPSGSCFGRSTVATTCIPFA